MTTEPPTDGDQFRRDLTRELAAERSRRRNRRGRRPGAWAKAQPVIYRQPQPREDTTDADHD